MASRPSVKAGPKTKGPAHKTATFGAIAERFRRAGELERAVDLCREGLQNFPDLTSAQVTLGRALLELRKFDEARVELEDVLRRAPDNLAAIRGLAELHDQSEASLNLSMDGPGVWPPSPESIDELDATPSAESFLDLHPIVTINGELQDAVAAEIVGRAEIPPPETETPIWAPATYEPAPTVHQPASGMSSLREISADAFETPAASAPEPEVDLLISAPAVASSSSEVGVSNADLAALIAEADSLESVAELRQIESVPAEPMSILPGRIDSVRDVLNEIAEINEIEELVELVAPIESRSTDVAEDAPVAEPEVPRESEAVVHEPVAFVESEPVMPVMIDEPEVVSAPARAMEQEALPEPVPEAVAEMENVATAEPQVDVEPVPEPVLVAQPESAWEPEVVADPEPMPEPLPEPVVESVVFAPHAEVGVDSGERSDERDIAERSDAPDTDVPLDLVAAASIATPVRLPLPALERMLARVQAHRARLMAESVA